MDSSYLPEAFKLFGLLLKQEKQEGCGMNLSPLTLLESVFAEGGIGQDPTTNSHDYFTSQKFIDHCLYVETRVLTRCAGLVEIKERWLKPLTDRGNSHRDQLALFSKTGEMPFQRASNSWEPWEVDGMQNPVQQNREVLFIHRTVGEFLRTEYGTLFQNKTEPSETTMAMIRGKLGVLNLIPVIVSPFGGGKHYVSLFAHIAGVMDCVNLVGRSESAQGSDQACAEEVVKMVNQIFRNVGLIDEKLNEPCVPWFKHYKWTDINHGYRSDALPFHDAPGFAAFFGCQRYFMHSTILHGISHERSNYLLACAVCGFSGVSNLNEERRDFEAYLHIIRELLHLGADPNSTLCLDQSDSADQVKPISLWVRIFRTSMLEFTYRNHALGIRLQPVSYDPHFTGLIALCLSSSSDPNSSIFSSGHFKIGAATIVVDLQETPLSWQESLFGLAIGHIAPSSPHFEISKTLRSYGGTEGRRCHLIRFEGIRPNAEGYDHILRDRRYLLSQVQSDYLCRILQRALESPSGRDRRDLGLEFLDDFLTLVATLTEAHIL